MLRSLLSLILVGQADPAAPASPPPPAVAEAAPTHGLWQIVAEADPLVKLVMLLLFAISVASWAVIIHKTVALGRAQRASAKFLELFWHSKHLDDVYNALPQFSGAPLAQVFKAAYNELGKVSERQKASQANPHQLRGAETVARSLRRSINVEMTEMERLTPFLATASNASPFIGLFGTVWGIMRAFQEIGISQSTSIATVGPYISEALIATAVGLFAAIPAGIFYNYFVTRTRVLGSEMENFSHDLLNIVERHLTL